MHTDFEIENALLVAEIDWLKREVKRLKESLQDVRVERVYLRGSLAAALAEIERLNSDR